MMRLRNGVKKKKRLYKRIPYYFSVLNIVLKCFWKHFIMPESRVFRNQAAVCLCFVLLISTVLCHATISRMSTEEFVRDDVSVTLDTEHSAVEEGSEELPYVLVSFTNKGDSALEKVSVRTVEKDFRLEFPWEKGEDKKNMEGDNETVVDEGSILEPGQVMTARITAGKETKPGLYKGNLYFEAERENGEQIAFLVPFQLKIKESAEIQVTEVPAFSQTPEITEVPQVTETVFMPTSTAIPSAVPEGTPVSSSTPVNGSAVGSTETPIHTPQAVKPLASPKENQSKKWEINETGVSGGYSEDGIYFGADYLRLHFCVRESGTVLKGAFYYTFAGRKEKVPTENGEAVIELKGSYSGEVTVYFQDLQGNHSALWNAYCVLDSAAPEIEMKKVSNSLGEERVKVVITEPSEVISGLKQISVYVNGEDYGENREDIQEEDLQNRWHAKKRSVFYLPLKGDGEQEYLVRTADASGNMAEKKLNAARSSPSDIISVVVPTEFSLRMNPYAKDQQIYSDMIPVINRSDFNIDMQISSIEVRVNSDNAGGQKKDCDMNLDILQDGVRIDSVLGLDPATYQSPVFSLEKDNRNLSSIGSKRIDFFRNGISKQILPTIPYSGKNVACIQLTGKLSEGSERLWRNGDLGVTVVFDFSKRN